VAAVVISAVNQHATHAGGAHLEAEQIRSSAVLLGSNLLTRECGYGHV